MSGKKRKALFLGLMAFLFVAILYVSLGTILTGIGNFLVFDQKPVHSDAVVVLNTGMEYYPRLIEAARLFQNGFVRKIVINGNRKTDALRSFEKMGFQPCCPWYEERLRILEMLGVPRKYVILISAEDAYDTVSEATAVGNELIRKGFKRIIVASSKSHTRRANFIWSKMFRNKLSITSVSAKADQYDPQGWWKEGRQIRWVLSEYGAWLFYFWKKKGKMIK